MGYKEDYYKEVYEDTTEDIGSVLEVIDVCHRNFAENITGNSEYDFCVVTPLASRFVDRLRKSLIKPGAQDAFDAYVPSSEHVELFNILKSII